MSAKLHPRQFEPADELLRCEVVPERGGVRICPLGALDMATAPVLEHELAELRAAGFRRLIIDLRGLRFMDSTGLRLVLRWHAAAQSDGFEVGVVPGAPAIQRVFELTGTLHLVPFLDSG
jgi:anti-sigma B factor antagonist